MAAIKALSLILLVVAQAQEATESVLQQQLEQQQRLTLQQQLKEQQLASIGPVVVNKDGSLSRIANWKELAPTEREAALIAIARRNWQRLDAAAAREAAQGQARPRARGVLHRLVRWLRRVFSRGRSAKAAGADNIPAKDCAAKPLVPTGSSDSSDSVVPAATTPGLLPDGTRNCTDGNSECGVWAAEGHCDSQLTPTTLLRELCCASCTERAVSPVDGENS